MPIIPFHPRHLSAMRPMEGLLEPDWPDPAAAFLRMGPAFSFVQGSRVLASGGVLLASPASGFGWAVVDRAAAGRALALRRAFLFVLDRMGQAGLTEVLAVVRRDFPAGARWARSLGFHRAPGVLPEPEGFEAWQRLWPGQRNFASHDS